MLERTRTVKARSPQVKKDQKDSIEKIMFVPMKTQHGSVQCQRQRAEVNGNVWGHAKPMAVCMENIYASSRVFSDYWNPATNLRMVFHDSMFGKYSLRNSLRNNADGVNSAAIPDAYNYWSGDDSVSFEKFLPISSFYDITFTKTMAPLDEDIWIPCRYCTNEETYVT